MDADTLNAHAISEKARAERLYLHYALALATLFAIGGAILTVLALGDRLDVIVKGNGGLDVRLLNAAPGFALCLAAIILFAVSRPRRLPAPVSHSEDLEERIERAVSSRLEPRNGVASRAPATLLHHVAESLADALEQSALEALPALRKSREAPPAAQDRAKPNGAATGDI